MAVNDYQNITFLKECVLNERQACQRCGSKKDLMIYFADAEARNKNKPEKILLLCAKCFKDSANSETNELIYFQTKLNRPVFLDEIR